MVKKPIGIVVDISAELPKEIIEKYQIEVVPIKADWPELDNFSGNNIFQKMREWRKSGLGANVKSSQPPAKDFLDAYSRQLEKFEKVICVTVTSKHSGTYNSACQAKKMLENNSDDVFVVDSLNVCGGVALIVFNIIKLIEENKTIEEILKKTEEFIPNTNFYIFLEEPRMLAAIGRISETVAGWIEKMKKIGVRPLLGLKSGKISPLGIKIGVNDVAVSLFKEFESKSKDVRDKGKKIQVIISHGDNISDAKRLKEIVETLENTEVIFINMLNDIMGLAFGPDSIILTWAPID